MSTLTFDVIKFIRPVLRSIVFHSSIIVMAMVRPAQASGTLSTPPSLQYSVSYWCQWNQPRTAVSCAAISCFASSLAGLAPCVAAAAGGPVGYYSYDGNYSGGVYPGGYSDAVASHIGCPDNSTGTPASNPTACTCNDPYVPEEPNRTRCVLEQYTLSLQIAPGQVEPSGSASVIATVVDAQGQPKDGVTVSVKVDVEAGSGGHDHDAGRHVSPYTGTLSAATGTTVSDGTVSFNFGAPEVSGIHTFTAQCDSPTCTNNPQTAKIDVKVDNLSTIPDSQFYTLIGATDKHSDNHYLTATATQNLMKIVKKYNATYPGAQLYLNDASLIWGGKFDIAGNWAGDHAEHRRGVVIDIRANGEIGTIPLIIFPAFELLAKKEAGSAAELHGSGTNRHIHMRLLGDQSRF